MIICTHYSLGFQPAKAFDASLRRHVAYEWTVVGAAVYDPPLLASFQKPSLMLEIMERNNQSVLWLDADTIVRGPLDRLAAIVECADLTILHRPKTNILGPLGTPHACKFNAGVVGVNNTDGGRAFLEQWARMLETFQIADHYLDQEAAYIAYWAKQKEIRLRPLPPGFNDATFQPYSAIWHGKGSAREHILYKLEAARYTHNLPLWPVIDLLQLARRCAIVKGAYRLWWNRNES